MSPTKNLKGLACIKCQLFLHVLLGVIVLHKRLSANNLCTITNPIYLQFVTLLLNKCQVFLHLVFNVMLVLPILLALSCQTLTEHHIKKPIKNLHEQASFCVGEFYT